MSPCPCEGKGLPSKPRIVLNAVNAAGRALAAAASGGALLVDDQERVRRMDICQQCDQWRGGTCAECGCKCRLKTRLATESCPIGKW